MAPPLAPEQVPADWIPRSDVDFDALGRQLKPLGNPTRLRLLHFLTAPHHLEEVASRLRMSREGARKHVAELVRLGVVRRQEGRRETGPVTEYVLDRARLYQIDTEFAKLGRLKPTREADLLAQTLAGTATPAAPAAATPAAPDLLLLRGFDDGRVFPLSPEPGRVWRIGRQRGAEIRLDYDPFLSQRHAEVRREGPGFVLVDAFSSNGTFLNGRRLGRGESVALGPGDLVGLGRSLLLFRWREPR